MATKDTFNTRDERHFEHAFPDFSPKSNCVQNNKYTEEFIQKLHFKINQMMNHLDTKLEGLDQKDISVYTGLSGVAYLYWHLSQSKFPGYDRNKARETAHSLLGACEGLLKRKRETFLCGDAGPLTLLILMNPDDHRKYLKRLLDLADSVISNPEIPDELLYGRVGYLYSLLALYSRKVSIPTDIINKIIDAVIDSGERLARSQFPSTKDGENVPGLLYEWHNSVYLGAAHGLIGIVSVLMQAILLGGEQFQRSRLLPLIESTLNWLVSLRYPSGNFPSSLGSSGGDRLVHWCHGAPGWVHMLLLANKVFEKDIYLQLAEGCGEVVWSRGLLKKGYGLCHGAAGNAYTFLALYTHTRQERHLHRAAKFAEWCFDYGKHNCRSADRPYSLFEGLSGTIYFLVDLLEPNTAKFPGFII